MFMVGMYVVSGGVGSLGAKLYFLVVRTRMASGVKLISATMDGRVGWNSRFGLMS